MNHDYAYTPQDARNLRIFSGWALAAALVFSSATLLIGERILPRGVLAWCLAVTATLLAFGAVRSYMIFLRSADELLRKIQLEGLALGFGAGAVFTLGWRLFERLGAPKLDIVDGLPVMMLFWALGQYLGFRRYGGGGEP